MGLRYFVAILFLISSFFFGKSATAKQSDDLINLLSQTIYTDCHGEKLILKDESLLDLRGGMQLKTLKQDVFENYDIVIIKEIIEIFDSIGKFPYFLVINGEKTFVDNTISTISLQLADGTSREIPFDGRSILRCGSHTLDINGTDYYWDNKKIELPKNIYNQNNFSLFGVSLISNGGLTIFSFTLFGFSLLGGITLFVIIVKYSKRIISFLYTKKQ